MMQQVLVAPSKSDPDRMEDGERMNGWIIMLACRVIPDCWLAGMKVLASPL